MNRRTFLRGSLSVIPTSYVTGCLSWVSRGSVELHVLNWTDDEQTFDIRAKQGTEIEYEENVTLSGNESVRKEDILPGGQYTVVTSVIGGPTERFEFRMNGCEDQEITVIYQGQMELDIHQKRC